MLDALEVVLKRFLKKRRHNGVDPPALFPYRLRLAVTIPLCFSGVRTGDEGRDFLPASVLIMEQKERLVPHDDPDVQLMLRFQKGDIEAFQQLFHKYSPSVVNFAFRFLGTQARAEEIAQEVFLQVYRWQNRYEPKAKFSTWLFKIAHNHCLNEVRKGEYRISLESLDPPDDLEGDERERNLPDTTASKGEDILAAKEAADRIEKVLQRVPKSQRTALLLSRMEGMSYQEVAEVLGSTEKAVKSLVFRATQSLKEGLRDILDSYDL